MLISALLTGLQEIYCKVVNMIAIQQTVEVLPWHTHVQIIGKYDLNDLFDFD